MTLEQTAFLILGAGLAVLFWAITKRARHERPIYEREQREQLSRLLAKIEGDLIMAQGIQHQVLEALHHRVEELEITTLALDRRIAAIERRRPAEQQ